MEVRLINYTKDGVKLVADAVRTTADFFDEMADERIARRMVRHDYGSVLEHIYFTFELKDISVAISRELLEHRIASHTARSTRYSDEGGFGYYVPPEVEKDPRYLERYMRFMVETSKFYREINERFGREAARYVLPMATHCTYVWTINARSLINFLKLRLCVLAAPEMQELAQRVKALAEEKYPVIFKSIECRATPLGVCPEPKSRSCGRYPTTKDAKALKK